MLDQDPDVRHLFSQIGQIVAYGRFLHRTLHSGCTTIFIAQGFEAEFAHAMMSDQDTEILCNTWSNLVKDDLEIADPAALAPLTLLTERLHSAIEAAGKLMATDWILDQPPEKAAIHYNGLPEPTLAGGDVPLELLVLEQSNLSAALGHISTHWQDRGQALLDQALAMLAA